KSSAVYDITENIVLVVTEIGSVQTGEFNEFLVVVIIYGVPETAHITRFGRNGGQIGTRQIEHNIGERIAAGVKNAEFQLGSSVSLVHGAIIFKPETFVFHHAKRIVVATHARV